MKKIGISVDYSNICTDYNTAYLDRDNLDPATSKCMKRVLTWTKEFLSELLDNFEYKLFHLHSSTLVTIDEIASKRFLFYSLEKDITLQSYTIQKEYIEYTSLASWEQEDTSSILVKNDEDGGAIFFYFNENSKEQQWIKKKLEKFSLEEVPFQAK